TGKTTLPPGGNAAWSADGQRIAISAGVSDIRVMNADGTNQQTVTSGNPIDWEPTWSPSGSRIAFDATQREDGSSCSSYDRELYITDLAGNVTEVPTALGDKRMPDWSPDGGKIAFTFYEWSIVEEDPFCEV